MQLLVTSSCCCQGFQALILVLILFFIDTDCSAMTNEISAPEVFLNSTSTKIVGLSPEEKLTQLETSTSVVAHQEITHEMKAPGLMGVATWREISLTRNNEVQAGYTDRKGQSYGWQESKSTSLRSSSWLSVVLTILIFVKRFCN